MLKHGTAPATIQFSANQPSEKSFTVTIRAPGQELRYDAMSVDSCTAHMAAIDRFGVCAVTVTPIRAPA